jgi:signal transduction histidine kinase
MFHNSLRFRLVALYLAIATVAVVLTCVIGSIAIVEFDTANVRATMATAMHDIPALLASYDGSPQAAMRADALLQTRYQNSGIIAHVLPQPPLPGASVGFVKQAGPIGIPPPFTKRVFDDRGPGYFSVAFNTADGKRVTTKEFGPGAPPDEHLFFRLFPIRVFPERIELKNGAVMLFADPIHVRGVLDRYLIFAGLFAFVTLLLAWRVADAVAAHALQPLLRTTEALNRFGDGDFTPEAVRTNDHSELGKLALAYNRAVAQITRALDERSKAEREMRQFVGDAGHQLRTPLTVIMGYLTAAASREGSQRQHAALSSMLAESRRMKALIDDLIVLAKLEHPASTDNTAVEVNELARDVVQSFATLAGNRIAFTPSKTSVYVNASKSELFAALAALVDNALKYSQDSPVSVAMIDDAKLARLEVADRGPGIAEGEIEKVFDRFYRGESSHGVMGTGLGLAIVRRSIERAHGSVSVRNRPGGGLACTVSLPKTVPTAASIVAA